MNLKTSLFFLLAAAILTILFIQSTVPHTSAEEAEVETEGEPEQKIVKGHITPWDVAVWQVMQLADAMPEELLNYRPHDSIRTFAEQLVHIAESSAFLSDHFLNDVPIPKTEPKDPSSMNREELKAYLQSEFDKARVNILAMTDDQLLNDTIRGFSGRKMIRLEGLWFVHDHLTNHKAKANLYIRLSGNEPPRYRYY